MAYNKSMDNKELGKITKNIEKTVGKDMAGAIAADLGKIVTGFEANQDIIKSKDEEIAELKDLKEKLELRLGCELINCAIAMPAGTESSAKTHQYVAEGAGFEVINILDEPTAANSIYGIQDGVVVDIGGGTTGLAIFSSGEVVRIEDEPTGGTHLTLVLAGNYRIPIHEAELMKQDYKRHREILPIVKAVIEKMASIINKYVDKDEIDAIYLCGGTCCLTDIENIIERETGIHTVKPLNPFLVTPAGIAMNCK